jgi:hypothetical protein
MPIQMPMHPIHRITRRELAERWRDGRLLWSSVSLCVLLTISFGFGWHTYKVRSSQRRAIQDSERARWLAQRYRSPHVAAGQGVYVFRPEPPLASLEPGIDSFKMPDSEHHNLQFRWEVFNVTNSQPFGTSNLVVNQDPYLSAPTAQWGQFTQSVTPTG